MTAFQMSILGNSLTSPRLPAPDPRSRCAIMHSIMSCYMSPQPLECGEFMIRTQDSAEEFLAFMKLTVSFLNLRKRERLPLFELTGTAVQDSK